MADEKGNIEDQGQGAQAFDLGDTRDLAAEMAAMRRVMAPTMEAIRAIDARMEQIQAAVVAAVQATQKVGSRATDIARMAESRVRALDDEIRAQQTMLARNLEVMQGAQRSLEAQLEAHQASLERFTRTSIEWRDLEIPALRVNESPDYRYTQAEAQSSEVKALGEQVRALRDEIQALRKEIGDLKSSAKDD
jgi:chromosome segregation ATPase